MLAAFDNKKLYSNRSRLFGVLLLCVDLDLDDWLGHERRSGRAKPVCGFDTT